MTHVALLRGINVGGKNKVEMARLRETFARLGLDGVRTYLNTGNVIFRADRSSPSRLASRLEEAIEEDFGLAVKVLVREADEVTDLARALPDSWVNDDTMKCDVMFLWEEVDRPEVVEQLKFDPDIDDVRYLPGAIVWRVDRPQVTRSGMMRLVGTDLYKRMTIRNVNTVRKLAQLLAEG